MFRTLSLVLLAGCAGSSLDTTGHTDRTDPEAQAVTPQPIPEIVHLDASGHVIHETTITVMEEHYYEIYIPAHREIRVRYGHSPELVLDSGFIHVDGMEIEDATPMIVSDLDHRMHTGDEPRTIEMSVWQSNSFMTAPYTLFIESYDITPEPEPDPGATALALNGEHQAFLGEAEIQAYTMTFTEPGWADVMSWGDVDTYGWVTDPGGEIIDEDDDSGSITNFLLSFPTEPGVYTIYVRGYAGETTGSYSVQTITE